MIMMVGYFYDLIYKIRHYIGELMLICIFCVYIKYRLLSEAKVIIRLQNASEQGEAKFKKSIK